MMYFCEYCNKAMTLKLRKAHDNGLPHKIEYANHWAENSSPEDILKVEYSKKPCNFFFKGGNCRFGAFCQNSHYTRDQLRQIEELNNRIKKRKEKIITFKNEKTNKKKNQLKKILNNYYKHTKPIKVVPSLIPIKFSNMKNK